MAAAPRAAAGRGESVTNPLLAPWRGPYGGVPPFDAVEVRHFAPAFEAAMAEQLAAVERIATDPTPPSFENTLAALERSGRTFARVRAIFRVWSASLSTPELRAVERDLAPRLAAFRDRIAQDERLFRRVEAVHAACATLCRDAEQRRLAWLHHTTLVRAGARLEAAQKRRVAEINARLATLFTTFAQNVLADEDRPALVIDDARDLAGLPAPVRAAAAAAAEARGQPGKWLVLNTRSSVEPFLATSSRRDLRERVWRAFVGRGDGGAHDNGPAITEILALRAERARLLGYPTHAHWRVEDSMAGTPERALALMEAVWPAAVARVREEVADMTALAAKEGEEAAVEPWDYRHWAEKVRRARYDVDEEEVKPYLQLEKLREGMFWVAGRLFGLHFTPARGVAVPHPDVRVWQVKDGKGKPVGLWYFDPWAREGKRSGAWMSGYRPQERLDGAVLPLVSNNANFLRGRPGEPVLLGWNDAVALFHEFGHGLHGLLSSVTYPSLAAPEVPRDYAEFPSQILERWLAAPELLSRFAVHHRTGEPIPDALVAKLERAGRFNQGFDTVEYLSGALVDMKAHLAPGPVDAAAFERETLAALGMPREIAMRHRLPHFVHVFAGDGYSAGYYSYLWADAISADAYEAFLEAGGPWDAEVAARLRRAFAAGNAVDPAESYRAFRGHDPGIGALMRRRGFPVAGTAEQGRR
jgi:peptidyl-dipeptidase Dcp